MFGYYFYKTYYNFVFESADVNTKAEAKNLEVVKADAKNPENEKETYHDEKETYLDKADEKKSYVKKDDTNINKEEEDNKQYKGGAANIDNPEYLKYSNILKEKVLNSNVNFNLNEIYHVYNKNNYDSIDNLTVTLPCCYDYVINRELKPDGSPITKETNSYFTTELNVEDTIHNKIINGIEAKIDDQMKINLESDYIEDIIDKDIIVNFYENITKKKHSFDYIYNMDFTHLYKNYLNSMYKKYPFILKIHSIDYNFIQVTLKDGVVNLLSIKENNFNVIKTIQDLLDNLNKFKDKKKIYDLIETDLKNSTTSIIIKKYNKMKNDIDQQLEKKLNEKIMTFIKINVIEDLDKIKKDEVGETISNKKYYNDYRFNVKINNPKNTKMLVKYNDDQKPFNYLNNKESPNNTNFSNNYVLGNFTKIFLPTQDNDEIINNEHISTLINNIIGNPSKPVFLFGYGSSGSGKTSSLIYYRDINNEINNKIGIIPILCNKICVALNSQHKTEIYLNVKVIELINSDIVTGNDENYRFKYNNQNNNIMYIKNTGKDNTIKIRNPFRFNNFENNTNKSLREKSFEKYFTNFSLNDRGLYEYSEKNNLAEIMVFLVDIDRNVKATNNNPQSSRSHVLVFIDFFKNDNNTFINLANIVVGDFAGVENSFLCDNMDTLNEMKKINNTLTNQKFYLNLNDISTRDREDFSTIKDETFFKDKIDTSLKRILENYDTEIKKQDDIIDYLNKAIEDNNDNKISYTFDKNEYNKALLAFYKDDNDYITQTENFFKDYNTENGINILYNNKIFKKNKGIEIPTRWMLIHFVIGGHKYVKTLNISITDYINGDVYKKLKKLNLNNTGSIFYFIKNEKDDGFQIDNTEYQNTKFKIVLLLCDYNILIQYDKEKRDLTDTTKLIDQIKTDNKLKKLNETYKLAKEQIEKKKDIDNYAELNNINNEKDIDGKLNNLKTTIPPERKKELKNNILQVMYKKNINEYLINLLSYYTAIKNSCEIRKKEGTYINNSLNELNESISIIVKDFINPFYNYIDDCNYVYTRSKNDKSLEYILKNEKNLLNIVIQHIVKTTKKDPIQITKDLIICVFGVLDFSRTKNNPPPVPYIDLTNLHEALFNSTNQTNDINDVRNKINEKIKILKENYAYYTNINITNENNNAQSQLKFIKDISTINSASTMGTLEFFDKLAKLNTTETICNTYDTIEKGEEEFIDLKKIHTHTIDYNKK